MHLKNPQITRSSISLENKTVICSAELSARHIRIVKLMGACWSGIHIQFTSKIWDTIMNIITWNKQTKHRACNASPILPQHRQWEEGRVGT